jgi:hypothetical protein
MEHLQLVQNEKVGKALEMNKEDYEKIEEIQRLLDEAYDHYFKYESHAKSYEGRVAVHFNNYWDRRENESGLEIDSIEIASYVFCRRGRNEFFDTIDEALDNVRGWHRDEMAYDYNAPEEVAAREGLDQFASDWIDEMQKSGKLHVHMIGEEDELQ